MPELSRYHRQTLLRNIGDDGQRRLLDAHAVIVGIGALGCVSSDLLCRAGVGRITLIDRDVVELTNLQRQTLYTERDVEEGLPKAEAARRRLAEVNSSIRLHAEVADLEPRNAERLILQGELGRADVLIDGTDNYETRFLLNDLAVKHDIPYVYGGAVATHGMAYTVVPGETTCLRCVFDEPSGPGTDTCDTVGVLGATVAIVASYQAGEAIKLLTGNADRLAGSLLEFDQWENTRRRHEFARRDDCACCVGRQFAYLESEREGVGATLCGRDAVQIDAKPGANVELGALADRLGRLGRVDVNPFLLRAEIEGREITVFRDGRAIVGGTDRPEVARSVYAKYIGA